VRKELFGPLPLALGAVALVAAALTTHTPPPADCACPIESPAEFEARDAAGYPGTALNGPIVVDGQVVQVHPHTLVDAPYRLIRLDGSSIEFNVTDFDEAPPFVGTWARLTTVHQGQGESGGPDTGHRWRYLGPTTPAGASFVSVAAYSVGLAGVVWGLATVGTFRRAREAERSLKQRRARLEEQAGAEPAVAGDEKALAALAAARREIRFGQYESAGETLGKFEAQLVRAQDLGKMMAQMEATLSAQEAALAVAGTSHARALVAKADGLRRGADIAAAESALERAMEEIRAGGRATELLARARALSADDAEAVAAERASAAADEATALLAAGKWAEAERAAREAASAALDASPAARRARDAIQALEDAVQADRTADSSRAVSHQLAAARSAYAAAEFGRAVSLAESARWVVDAEALGEEGFRVLIARLWGARGYRPEVGAARPPSGGIVFSNGGERVLVLTAAWREFPAERLLLAAKDFLREGHADRALVYSSAFANTSTDPSVTVGTMRELLADLAEAAALPGARPD